MLLMWIVKQEQPRGSVWLGLWEKERVMTSLIIILERW